VRLPGFAPSPESELDQRLLSLVDGRVKKKTRQSVENPLAQPGLEIERFSC